MRLALIGVFHFISGAIYCQSEYTLTVEASDVRIWNTPRYIENYNGERLTKKENIIFINKQVQDLGNTSKKFYSFYRNDKSKTVLYFLSSEINVLLSKKIIANVSDAIIKENVIKSIFLPCTYTSIKKGDILSISNTGYYTKYRSIFTFLNRASYSFNDALDSRARGLYRIKDIYEYDTYNETKTILQCEALSTPFNNSPDFRKIYIDYSKAIESDEIQMHTLGEQNDFNYSLISAAYLKNNPQLFYEEYLSLIFGKDSYTGMDEFQKHKLMTSGIATMDSLYNLKNKILERENKNVFTLGISEYDFSNKWYYITEFSEDLEKTLMYNSLPKLCQSSNSPSYQRGFINLRLFDSVLRIEPDKAEIFLKKISNRQIVAVAYFHWLDENQAKEFSKKYNIEPESYNYQKVIDSIVIFPNKKFEQGWFTLYPRENVQPNSKSVITIAASFPGGQLKFRQYVEKNLKKRSGDVIRVDYKLKVKVDGSLEILELKTDKAEDSENIKNLLISGPRWQPAIVDGRQLESIIEGYWLF